MMTRVLYEPDRVEVYVPTSRNLAAFLVVEVLLGVGIYFLATHGEDSGRYVFVIVGGFFFLAIGAGLLPAINNIRSSNRSLVWAATPSGFELPAKSTTWTEMRSPHLYSWATIARLMVADTLKIRESDGIVTTWNALVLYFTPEARSDSAALTAWQRLRRESSASRYEVFRIPKAHKQEIVGRLRLLAPAHVKVEHLHRYDLGDK